MGRFSCAVHSIDATQTISTQNFSYQWTFFLDGMNDWYTIIRIFFKNDSQLSRGCSNVKALSGIMKRGSFPKHGQLVDWSFPVFWQFILRRLNIDDSVKAGRVQGIVIIEYSLLSFVCRGVPTVYTCGITNCADIIMTVWNNNFCSGLLIAYATLEIVCVCRCLFRVCGGATFSLFLIAELEEHGPGQQ